MTTVSTYPFPGLEMYVANSYSSFKIIVGDGHRFYFFLFFILLSNILIYFLLFFFSLFFSSRPQFYLKATMYTNKQIHFLKNCLLKLGATMRLFWVMIGRSVVYKARKVPWKDFTQLENVSLCFFPHILSYCLKWVHNCWSYSSTWDPKWHWRWNWHAKMIEQRNIKNLDFWWPWDFHASSGLFTYQLNLFLSNYYFGFSIFTTN